MEFLTAYIAPIIFIAMVGFLLFGYPVAFALAANGIFFGLVGIELGLLQPSLFGAMPERIFGVMANDTLLAIPFFTLMGLILERSGMAEDLLDTIGQLFGPIRGGLAYAVIFVGALLAATTGVVAASVISMGLISLPIMLRYGYDRRLASGVIAASGTLAQIIPPSLVLIIMADQLGRSVGDMYKGAFIPGFVLTGLYVGYIVLVTLVKPKFAPALPPEARVFREPSGIIVDLHVTRLVERLGITAEKDATKIEALLCALLPRRAWVDVGHRLVLHGRHVCTARRPRCGLCPLGEHCPSAAETPAGRWTERAAWEQTLTESRGRDDTSR